MRTVVALVGKAFTASCCQCAHGPTASCSGGLSCRPSTLQLLHCLSCLFFDPSELLDSVSLFDCQTAHKALVSLDIRHVQVDLLLEHDKLFVHFNLEAVPSRLDLGLHLNHFFLLIRQQSLALVVSILLLQILHSFSFLDLEGFEFLAVVHGLVDSLIDSD